MAAVHAPGEGGVHQGQHSPHHQGAVGFFRPGQGAHGHGAGDIRGGAGPLPAAIHQVKALLFQLGAALGRGGIMGQGRVGAIGADGGKGNIRTSRLQPHLIQPGRGAGLIQAGAPLFLDPAQEPGHDHPVLYVGFPDGLQFPRGLEIAAAGAPGGLRQLDAPLQEGLAQGKAQGRGDQQGIPRPVPGQEGIDGVIGPYFRPQLL